MCIHVHVYAGHGEGCLGKQYIINRAALHALCRSNTRPLTLQIMTLHVITSNSVFWDYPHRNLIRRSVESRKGRIVCSFETISRQESCARSSRDKVFSKRIPSSSAMKNRNYEIN